MPSFQYNLHRDDDDDWCLGLFCANGSLNGPSDIQKKWSEVKDETPIRYAHAEIQTQVVVIWDPMRYQLDHGGDPICIGENCPSDNQYIAVLLMKSYNIDLFK